jgi:uncharacterized membrane protein YeiH
MIETIEFSAVVASAIFGVLLAARKEMDAVGIITVALAVAFGGGTLRDLFLDRTPLFWIAKQHYTVIVFSIALAGSLFPRALIRMERYLAIPDALGMGLFAVVGTSYSLDAGTSYFLAAILGTVTGTFGSVIGDVLCNEIPSLFRPAPLCATCAFTGAWLYLLCRGIGVDGDLALMAGVAAIAAFRLAALRWNIHLPSTAERIKASEPKIDETRKNG